MDGRFHRISQSIDYGYCVGVDFCNVKISVGRIKCDTKRVESIPKADVVCYCVSTAVDSVHGIGVRNGNVHFSI